MASNWFFEVLPVRPSPYLGECLSGYLLRLAEANRYTFFGEFVQDLFPMWATMSPIIKLRWEHGIDNWGRIPMRTQLSLSSLRKLTMAPWVEKFRPPLLMLYPSSPGRVLRGVVNPYLQACPLCLQTEPFMRLRWRLTHVQVCLEHGCLLQGLCHLCGLRLTVVGITQRHLCCAGCGSDMRKLAVVKASSQLLITQQLRQADFEFLLDSDLTLVKRECIPENLPQAIGLKFCYLREQANYCVSQIARQLGVSNDTIIRLECGMPPKLSLYLTYLKVFCLSFKDLAALEVPNQFVQNLAEVDHLALRACPNVECANHHPPSRRLYIVTDIPGQRVVCFHCLICGGYFTRDYDGRLVIKAPPIKSEKLLPAFSETARLTELGLQGIDNRQIASTLGVSEKTVRLYFLTFGLQEKVQQAQAERRYQKQLQHLATLSTRVEEILQSLLAQDEEITLRRVSLALGYNENYLQLHPGLVERVKAIGEPHNKKLKQHRDELIMTSIFQTINELKQDQNIKSIKSIRWVAKQAGISYSTLYSCYPDLFILVREAIQEHKTQIKSLRTQSLCTQIKAAAARVRAQGTDLSFGRILKEAGLSRHRAKSNPVLDDLLYQLLENPPQTIKS